MSAICFPYRELDSPHTLPDTFIIGDHLWGFDKNLDNAIFWKLNDFARSSNKKFTLRVDYVFEPIVINRYDCLDINFDMHVFEKYSKWSVFGDYTVHPEVNFQHMICSFNGSAHVSRQLLVAILERFRLFNTETCSKNFTFTAEALDGHLRSFTKESEQFYRKFFLSSQDFFATINGFERKQWDWLHNLHQLESKLTSSFLHVVSETMGTSYYPFITEKFLYSVITRGLFLSYAQPGWHRHLSKYYGFKLYQKIFDYKFDSVTNPVERLIELITMISKFSILSRDDWRDLYEMESDTIEYNYDHYFSRGYLDTLRKQCKNV